MLLLLQLGIAVKLFRFLLAVLRCHRIELVGVISCEGGNGLEVVQHDGIKDTLSDIVCGAFGGSTLETAALEGIVLRLYGFSSVKV